MTSGIQLLMVVSASACLLACLDLSLSADMATTNKIIEESIADPKALGRIRYRITHLAKDIIHLEEILGR